MSLLPNLRKKSLEKISSQRNYRDMRDLVNGSLQFVLNRCVGFRRPKIQFTLNYKPFN